MKFLNTKCQWMAFGKKEKRIRITHFNKPVLHGLAGMASSPLFDENIAIAIEKRSSDETDYNFVCLGFMLGGRAPRVTFEREFFYDFKRGTPEARTMLFHELGHYVNGDHLTTDESSADARMEAAQSGSVMEKEIRADDFAVEYLGAAAVREGLTAIKHRLEALTTNGRYDAEEVALGIAELERRISRIT